jgi:hypothetical protein
MIWFFAIAGVVAFFAWGAMQTEKDWKSWPKVEEYMVNQNPSKGKGISCHKCGSHQIWETGFEKSDSNMRIHFCKQCKTNLYRTQRN